jgi:hypothetical protein
MWEPRRLTTLWTFTALLQGQRDKAVIFLVGNGVRTLLEIRNWHKTWNHSRDKSGIKYLCKKQETQQQVECWTVLGWLHKAHVHCVQGPLLHQAHIKFTYLITCSEIPFCSASFLIMFAICSPDASHFSLTSDSNYCKVFSFCVATMMFSLLRTNFHFLWSRGHSSGG